MTPSRQTLCGSFHSIDFSRPTVQLWPVVKRLKDRAAHCQVFGAVAMTCMGIVCNGDVLPQFVAQIVSLDLDHQVILHIGSRGMDLVLTHESGASAVPQQRQPVVGSTSSEPAHVIHFFSGTTLTNQTAVPVSGTEHQTGAHMAAASSAPVDVFALKAALAYSRPPPGRTATSIHRSTLLLI